jgi:hypothetical protein
MEQEHAEQSHERVRHLAELVSLPVEEGRVPALAEALDAAMAAIDAIGALADAGGPPSPEAYDASWPKGERR